MKQVITKGAVAEDVRDDFNWIATIAMIFLVLSFIGASFYILVSSYLEIS